MNWKFWQRKPKPDLKAEIEHLKSQLRDQRGCSEILSQQVCDLMGFQKSILSTPEWDVEDDDSLRQFIHGTKTGKRFLAALHYLAQYQQQEAVLNRDHGDHRRGEAAGWHNAVAYIQSLSSKPKLSNGQPAQTQDGDAALRERLSP